MPDVSPAASAPHAPPSPVDEVDMRPFADNTGFWLRLAQQAAFDAYHRGPGRLGVSPGRLGVLLLLEANPDIRQGLLAEALRIKPSNLTVLLAAMEQEGLIQRTMDAGNRRANLLRLAPAGRALLRRASRRLADTEAAFTRNLSGAERATLLDLLRRVAQP